MIYKYSSQIPPNTFYMKLNIYEAKDIDDQFEELGKLLKTSGKKILDSLPLENANTGYEIDSGDSGDSGILDSLGLTDGSFIDKINKVGKEFGESVKSINNLMDKGLIGDIAKAKHQVILPLPYNLFDYVENHTSTTDFNIMDHFGGMMAAIGGVKAVQNGVTNAVNGKFDVSKSFSDAVWAASMYQSKVGGGDLKTILQRFGIVKNPNTMLHFENTSTRNWIFNFSLLPQRKEDEQVVSKMINSLRYFSAPVEVGRHLFLQTKWLCTFTIGYSSSKSNNLKINELMELGKYEAFIRSVKINIGDGNINSMFTSGMPKKIDMEISINERKPIYNKVESNKSDIKKIVNSKNAKSVKNDSTSTDSASQSSTWTPNKPEY